MISRMLMYLKVQDEKEIAQVKGEEDDSFPTADFAAFAGENEQEQEDRCQYVN